MIQWARNKLTEGLFRFIAFYFAGKAITLLKTVEGQIVYAGEGKVVGGITIRNQRRDPIGLLLLVHEPGMPPTTFKRLNISTVKRDKEIGWISHD